MVEEWEGSCKGGSEDGCKGGSGRVVVMVEEWEDGCKGGSGRMVVMVEVGGWL